MFLSITHKVCAESEAISMSVRRDMPLQRYPLRSRTLTRCTPLQVLRSFPSRSCECRRRRAIPHTCAPENGSRQTWPRRTARRFHSRDRRCEYNRPGSPSNCVDCWKIFKATECSPFLLLVLRVGLILLLSAFAPFDFLFGPEFDRGHSSGRPSGRDNQACMHQQPHATVVPRTSVGPCASDKRCVVSHCFMSLFVRESVV